jgi:hypothetical protein
MHRFIDGEDRMPVSARYNKPVDFEQLKAQLRQTADGSGLNCARQRRWLLEEAE